MRYFGFMQFGFVIFFNFRNFHNEGVLSYPL